MNNLMNEQYVQIKGLCNQVRDELLIAYNYFKKNRDYTAAYILYREINDVDSLYSKIDVEYANAISVIVVPSVYEWGFFERGFWSKERMDEVDNDYLNTLSVSCKEICFKDALFCGYYCYNVYFKNINWISFARNKAPKKAIPMYECVINHFEAKLTYFLKFESKN